MQKLNLPDKWTVRAFNPTPDVPAAIAGRTLAAEVPGCIHTDLLAAGLIVDPEFDQNEAQLQWIGRTDWRYEVEFDVSRDQLQHENLELACEGLDTIATLEVNGQPIGSAANMHIAQRFDLAGRARLGPNTLSITFTSPVRYAESMRDRLGDLPAQGNGSNALLPFNFIRKMACNFGWDWGPALTTCGVWRPIRLEAWSTARLGHVRPIVRKATPERAQVEIHADVAAADDAVYLITARLESPRGKIFTPEGSSPLQIEIADPELWWPVGYGEQPRYTLSTRVTDREGNLFDEKTQRIGIRTSVLVTDPDPSDGTFSIDGLKPGAGMHLEINGQRVFCKGANYIPDDYFPHRVTPANYRERITQSLDANMNMLRVWGGGLFESDVFYDICDELGLMVWQDMLFACAAYPEAAPFPELIEAEVRDNVGRLMHHPSLVLWNGNNENFMAIEEWDVDGTPWSDIIGDRVWGKKYYLEIVPELLAELDPQRPYWPGSPYSGEALPDASGQPPLANANEYGNRHIWDVWFGPGQYRNYLAHYPRFASEFGDHGPPTWPVIDRVIPRDQRAWNSPAMEAHNKQGGPGQSQADLRMGDDFVPPQGDGTFDDWLYLAQVMQARALEMGVTWFRALSPYCSGALYWQLNDCWPVSSWSAIDSDGRRKPLWYASRRFFAPRLITIKPRGVTPVGSPTEKLAVYCHNNSGQPWEETIRLRQVHVRGDTLQKKTYAVNIAPRATQQFDVPAEWLSQTDQTFLVADHPPASVTPAYWWFQPDKEIDYPEAEFNSTLDHTDGVSRLHIEAKTLIRDLCFFPDRLDPRAEISDQMVTLLPGDRATFQLQHLENAALEALCAPPVMQTTNRFGRNPSPNDHG